MEDGPVLMSMYRLEQVGLKETAVEAVDDEPTLLSSTKHGPIEGNLSGQY